MDGTNGTNGIDGEDGTNGSQGLPGEQGLQGLKGDKGDTGATGPMGMEGLPATMITPIIWSGSCSQYTNTGTIYCTDIVEFNTADGYLSVELDGRVTVETPGFYRVHFRGTTQFRGIWNTDLNKNGVTFHRSYNSNITDPAWTTPYGESIADVMQPFNAGDVITVRLNSVIGGHRYICCGQDPSGYHRLQIQYIGPLPAAE